MEPSTKVSMLAAKKKDWVTFFGLMARFTKDISRKITFTGRGSTTGQMDDATWENGAITKWTVMGYSLGLTGEGMKEST